MNKLLFRNRQVIIGFRDNAYGRYNNKRKRPVTYQVSDFHFYFVAEMRPTRGNIWYPCMPDPDGTTTPVNFVGRNIPTSLAKAIMPKSFFCPAQWIMDQEPENPVPEVLWDEAVGIAKELLIRFAISLIAHQMYWIDMSRVEPALRKRLNVGGVLDQYGYDAREKLTHDRAIGIPGWSEPDGCDKIFESFNL